MHELSIAQNIADIIKENVPADKLPDVRKVGIEIGDVSGIAADSLLFCFDVIKQENSIPDAELRIKKIPFVLFRNKCKIETTNTFGIRMCDACKEFDTKIVSGTEMLLTEVELK